MRGVSGHQAVLGRHLDIKQCKVRQSEEAAREGAQVGGRRGAAKKERAFPESGTPHSERPGASSGTAIFLCLVPPSFLLSHQKCRWWPLWLITQRLQHSLKCCTNLTLGSAVAQLLISPLIHPRAPQRLAAKEHVLEGHFPLATHRCLRFLRVGSSLGKYGAGLAASSS
jgi:hypothetical protein